MAVDDLDVVRVVAEMTMDGTEDQRNVFHVLKVAGGTISDQLFMDDVAAQLDLMYAILIPQQRTILTYDQITGQIVFGGTDLMPDTPWPVITAGINGADGLPFQVAALVLGQTVIAKTQGRKYLGGFLETNQFDSTINATLTPLLISWALEYITDFVSGANTYRFGTFNPLSFVFNAFASGVVQGILRTQRRRTAGFGS